MPDGKTLYFVRSTPDFSHWTIVFSRFANGSWSKPQVAPFSGKHSDADPFITPDGKRLYFISDRPIEGRSDLDIWFVEKKGDGWGEPKNVGAPVNSPGSEWYPTIAANGTLYFGSDRPGGKGRTDIYRCRLIGGKYADAENLGEPINTPYNEFEPLIAPDESWIIVMGGGRADSRGGFDLHISYNRNGAWTKPVGLGDKINSPANEYSPAISPDRKYFFWTSTRGSNGHRAGLGDIYYMDLSAALPPR